MFLLEQKDKQTDTVSKQQNDNNAKNKRLPLFLIRNCQEIFTHELMKPEA